MDITRFENLARNVSARLSRRAGLGLLAAASLPLLGFVEAGEAKKKKKITLCVQGQTVKKPKQKAKKLQKKGAGKGACRCGNGGPCTVFQSSSTFTGLQVGGLAGADAKCTSLASGAGIAGSFKAWLSAGNQTPALRFDNINNAGPWVLPRNVVDGANPPTVASDFSDLVTCGATCLQNAINRTQNGLILQGNQTVWTGTKADGTADANTCSGWTSEAGNGLFGDGSRDDAFWTDTNITFGCNSALALYCFQQAT